MFDVEGNNVYSLLKFKWAENKNPWIILESFKKILQHIYFMLMNIRKNQIFYFER